MKLINFLRFEDEFGVGAYMLCTAAFDFNSFHPTFGEDHRLRENFRSAYPSLDYESFIFGFCDYSQILKWIPKSQLEMAFAQLEREGLQCTGYSGDVVEGGYQSLIRKKTARRGRKIGFETLLKRIEETY